MNLFAQNLRFLRWQQELSLPAFAEKLGVFEESLKRWEREKAEPDLSTLIQISNELSISLDKLLKVDLALVQKKALAKKLKLILFDVDGTLTDGGLYYGEQGEEFKKFNVKDGMAIGRIAQRGKVQFGFISGSSTTQLITRRAEKLGVRFIHAGAGNKVQIVQGWLKELNVGFEQVAYLGDDINDLSVMKKVAISACPADAVRMVREQAQFVLSRNGGEGCVREFLEDVLGFELN